MNKSMLNIRCLEIVEVCWNIKHGSGKGSVGQSPPEAEAFWLIN